MRQFIHCAFCKCHGDGSGPGYFGDKFLLAIRPNSRRQPKGWACRDCLESRSTLDDRDFLNAFGKAVKRGAATR